MSLIEINDLWKCRCTASSQQQRLKMGIEVVLLNRHDVKTVPQASFTSLMCSQIMMHFVNICTVDQLTIISCLSVFIFFFFTFSTPAGMWTVVSLRQPQHQALVEEVESH